MSLRVRFQMMLILSQSQLHAAGERAVLDDSSSELVAIAALEAAFWQQRSSFSLSSAFQSLHESEGAQLAQRYPIRAFLKRAEHVGLRGIARRGA